MGKQNFIADFLCRLGGDKYTKEGTEASLQESLQEAQKRTVRFDIQNDKWILFSDQHKGAKNGADDFQRCENHYVTALDHYFKEGYSLCVMGDAEELWEEFPHTVIRKNDAVFAAERRFHNEGRYLRLWGNHDEIWSNPGTVRRLVQPMYGKRHLEIPESILLDAWDGEKSLGRILLIHGHQGTQNEGRSNRFAKWILHNIWRPLQILTHLSCNTPATDWELRHARDKIIYDWAVKHPGLVLIAGHTHAPVFESYSHRARLLAELSAARLEMEMLVEDSQSEKIGRIEKLSSDLQTLENKLSIEERQASEPLENPLPCYFNTGCCCFEDGDVTGIEMSAGEIRLVRWPDDAGKPAGKVLQAGSLKEIFQSLRQ
jgi:UDP-2,3-diacylglucosamine pyrophosphatase LpxH